MKKFVIISIVAALFITTSAAVFADGFKTPAEILSGLTGQDTTSLYEERDEGETFGSLAEEQGVLDEFKAQLLEQKKAIIEQRVKDGIMTRENADALIKALEENIAACDGTGNGGQLGMKYGAGFGMGQGQGTGQGAGLGRGNATGRGRGQGRGLGRSAAASWTGGSL